MSEARQTTGANEIAPATASLNPGSAQNIAVNGSRRLGVLSNPLSGANRKGLSAVREALAVQPRTIHCEVRKPADVEAALVAFARKEVNVLAVNGGDGTIQAVLTALLGKRPFKKIPLLAILRAGTDSVTSRDVGIKGSREHGLRLLLQWFRSGDDTAVVLRRSVLKVQIEANQEPLYGMILGAALVYDGIQFCHRRMYRLGLHGQLAPGLTLARYLLGLVFRGKKYLTPVPITVALDKQPPVKQDFLLVYISTLERLFLGIRPHWGKENGPLHYTAVAARPRHLLRAVPSLLRGRQGRYGTPDNGYFSHNVHEVRLTLNSGFTLDGELYLPDAGFGPVVVQDGGQVSFLRL